MPHRRQQREGGREGWREGGKKGAYFTFHRSVAGPTTCQVLQQIANASNKELKCTTNREKKSDCDTLTCTAMLFDVPVITKLTVLPCANVPAVNITIEATGIDIDEMLSESQMITIWGGAVTVDVTLNQLDGAIGILVRQ